MSKQLQYLGPGEQPTEREYNKLLDLVVGLLGSTDVQYFRDSRGVHARRLPNNENATQIFQITTVGVWGNYTCKKYVIDDTHWTGSSGQTKLIKVSDDTYTVFNLAENATTVSNALKIGDVLLARQQVDDADSNRWIGSSPKFAWWEV